MEPILTPPGPWAATIALPFGAPGGAYAITLARDGREETARRSVATPDLDGKLTLLIPPLEARTSWTLVLEPSQSSHADPVVYPFRIDGEQIEGEPSRQGSGPP